MGSIEVTEFAAGRHFGMNDFAGTKIRSHTPADFIAAVKAAEDRGEAVRAPGYFEGCQHLFVTNMTDALAGVMRITPENRHLLRSGYTARRDGELAVLARWFDSVDVDPPRAEWLDVILYSRRHLASEGIKISAEWGVVSVNSAEQPYEAPMSPITMMRNALGPDEGGSGVALDRHRYERAIRYWCQWATVK